MTAFRYQWTRQSTVDDKSVINLVRYGSAEEVIAELYGVPIDELAGGTVSYADGKAEEEKSISFEEMMENINEMAVYGFARKNNSVREIHFWFDADRVDPADMIGFFAHENGHLMKPYKRDMVQEEIKAERYADTAAFAYSVAMDLLQEKAA